MEEKREIKRRLTRKVSPKQLQKCEPTLALLARGGGKLLARINKHYDSESSDEMECVCMRGPGVGTSQVPSGDTDALVALVPSTCWMPNSQTPQGGVEHVPIPVKLKNNTFCSPADMLLKTKPLSCWTNTNDDIYFKICELQNRIERGFF